MLANIANCNLDRRIDGDGWKHFIPVVFDFRPGLRLVRLQQIRKPHGVNACLAADIMAVLNIALNFGGNE